MFPGNQNEQKSLKPLEQTVIRDFGCHKFIYCSDAGLGSESIREFNNIGERSFIVTQSIKKLKKEEKEWALDNRGFRRLSDGKEIEDISKIDPEDKDVYYKEDPYTPKRIHQNLIVTYSPKYAMYQKTIREKQIERANKMLAEGKHKRTRKNPNDPARFISQIAVTNQGEVADKKVYTLDEEKIAEESRYDGYMRYALTFWTMIRKQLSMLVKEDGKLKLVSVILKPIFKPDQFMLGMNKVLLLIFLCASSLF